MDTPKVRIGLLFGSFNPVHTGHLAMGEMALDSELVDVVWYVISPNSPYKMSLGILADAQHRLQMVNKAIAYNNRFIADTTEFEMEGPSYTYLTLQAFKEKYPDFEFYLICGTDVFVDIPTWHGGKEVMELSKFLVYPRNTTTNYIPDEMADKVEFLNGVPSLEISSTFLRNQIKKNKTTAHFMPTEVRKYIDEHKLYK